MAGGRGFRVLFIAGFGPIVRDEAASRALYADGLGIRFKEEEGGYLHTEGVKGANTFALWPLSQAARSCFGSDRWPEGVAAPHAWLEFDVDDVERATAELGAKGYRMLVTNRKEPWGADGQPVPVAGGAPGGGHGHAGDAGRTVTNAPVRRVKKNGRRGRRGSPRRLVAPHVK